MSALALRPGCLHTLSSLGRLERRAGDLAMAGLLLAALSYAASLLLIGVACDYRYLYVLDLSAMVGAFYVASTRGDRSAAV